LTQFLKRYTRFLYPAKKLLFTLAPAVMYPIPPDLFQLLNHGTHAWIIKQCRHGYGKALR
jgi:hypothetical protein